MYDEKAYRAYELRKALKLARPTLDCGHPSGGATYQHIWCDRVACRECAELDHDCSEYGGAKDGIEEAPEQPETVPPVPVVQSDASPWVSFADVAAGPSAGVTAALDVRRRVQDGAAPGPDRVGDALRAEVLRQGFTECEIDGWPWAYLGGRWMPAPDAPPAEAAPDPDPAADRPRANCDHCDWTATSRDPEQLPGLQIRHNEEAHAGCCALRLLALRAVAPLARRPWWKRWLP